MFIVQVFWETEFELIVILGRCSCSGRPLGVDILKRDLMVAVLVVLDKVHQVRRATLKAVLEMPGHLGRLHSYFYSYHGF